MLLRKGREVVMKGGGWRVHIGKGLGRRRVWHIRCQSTSEAGVRPNTIISVHGIGGGTDDSAATLDHGAACNGDGVVGG